MEKAKIALIGAGGMANRMHYPSLASFDDVTIVGLCDVDQQRLAATAQRFSIADTYTDYRAMLDRTRPDAVYVLMPPHHLFDLAMNVLERGHAMFIEKPPGVSTQQARAMAQRATLNRLVTSVGFQRRYQPLVRKCWELVKAKGRIHQVVSCFYKNSSPGDTHPYYGGAIDVLRCDAIHAVDALRYYAQLAEVKSVASEVRRLDASYAVSFNAIVHFANDVVGVLLTNWRSGRRCCKFEFHGYGAMAMAEIDGQGRVWVDNAQDPCFTASADEAADSDEEHISQGFWAENRAFVDAVKLGQPPHNCLEDAVKTMELADLIYEKAINCVVDR